MMNDNDIKKALERCGYHSECCYCNSLEECGSKRALVVNALDLINRQQAENERLQKHNEMVIENCRRYTEANDKANNQRFLEAIEVVKSEAIKEFAERLKGKFLGEYKTPRAVIKGRIDDLVKEMTEVQE